MLAPGAGEAAAEHVLLLLPQIALLDQQLRDVSRRIVQVLFTLTTAGAVTGSLSDASLILSIPGIGPAVASILLTEALGLSENVIPSLAMLCRDSANNQTKRKKKNHNNAKRL